MANLLKKITLVLATLAIPAVPIAARADTTANARAEAKKHFDRALELNEDGQVAEAVIELKRCYELSPHHTVLYDLGQAYIVLAKPVEAVAALQRYLEEGGKAIKPARRTEVGQEIARQKTRIATLEIRGLPDGAVVTIDGDDVGKAPLAAPVRVGVGKHVVAATAAGYEPGEAKIEVAGEDKKVVELGLVARVGLPPAAAVVGAGVGQGMPRPASGAPASAASPVAAPALAPAAPAAAPMPAATPSAPSNSAPSEQPVAAEPKPLSQHFEIGLFGGFHFYYEQSGLGRRAYDPEGLSPDTGWAFGLRLGYNFCRWVGVEGEATISPTHTRFSNDEGGTSVIIVGYRAQVIGTFIHTGYVRPFAVAGFGALSSFPNDSHVVPRDTEAMLHIGVGAKFPLTEFFGLRFDGRASNGTHFYGPDYEILLSAYVAFGP